MVVPSQLMHLMPFLVNTFEKCELEYAAALLIIWHGEQGYGDAWVPVSPKAIIEWAFETELPMVVEIRHNPFITPDFITLAARGYINGWESPDAVGTFSAKGLERLEALISRP
jgi:hypothetical protein